MSDATQAVRVDARGIVHTYDGATHLTGAAGVAAICEASRVVVFRARDHLQRLPAGARVDPQSLVDVACVARFLGFDDADDVVFALLPPGTSTTPGARGWLEALYAVGFGLEASGAEQQAMCRTHRINVDGVDLNLDRAAGLARAFADERERARSELMLSWPGLDAVVLRDENRFRSALHSKFGTTVTTTAMGSASGRLGRVVDARQRFCQFEDAAKRMRDLVAAGPRLEHFFNYAGAATGRFSCTGNLNLHGLPKHPKRELIGLVGIRGVVVPPPGRWFAARDFHAIEARVLSYLAGQDDMVARFARGEDVYAWFAGQVWPGVPIAKGGENAHLRDVGKVAVLSLGFGVGFKRFAEQVRSSVPGAEDKDLERAYREFGRRFPAVMSQHTAASNALHVATRRSATGITVCGATVERHGDVLELGLPSGRTLFCRGLVIGEAPDGSAELWRPVGWGRSRAAEIGTEPVPAGAKSHCFSDGVRREPLRPHVVVNNVVQAVARDICVHAENEIERRGVPIAFGVHDSIVGKSAADPDAWIEALATMEEVMGAVPRTLPRRLWDLPLSSEPEPGVMERYA